MVEGVVKYGRPVAHVCRDFHISRPIFYKWLKRYKAAPADKKIEALEDKKPKVERYYRQTPEKYEEAVLSAVAQYPELGVKKVVAVLPRIAGKPIVGYHGVQKILERHSLNTYEKRLAYARVQVTPVVRLISTWEEMLAKLFLLPIQTRRAVVRFVSVSAFSCFLTTVSLGILGYFGTLFSQAPGISRLGFIFATLALSVGSIFFLYSMKYYFTLALVLSFSREPGGEEESVNNNNNQNGWLSRIFNQRRKTNGFNNNIGDIKLKGSPFVSIHLPFYNEKRVAKRILKACSSMDYPHYEVIICDDSTDETVEIVQRYAKTHNAKHPNGPVIKVLHRPAREGFKGGALAHALEKIDPRTEFVIVFDADFIPYPDTIQQFLKYFKANNNNSEDYRRSKVACVAGYQWHVLNKSENWITRGVRAEYAGSYVIERSGQEVLGAMKLIHGSVYMIRADVLKEFGWGTSITEDFELTLKLYEKGYKVVYTPYIQAPAECVSTLKRLIRQRMRWAEGHSNNVKKMFTRLLITPHMTLVEKLEFLYLSPYYLQAAFFLVGTLSWLLSEAVFRTRLPFWTALWGWSLVLTNFFALPLMNTVGLFLEESEERDYLGLLSFVALSYILVPFQAYAAVKGFIEKEEGTWFRTPKTGKITDIFKRGTFYRWIRGILPWRGSGLAASLRPPRVAPAYVQDQNPYLALATANNQFNSFKIKPKRFCGVSKAALAILLAVSLTIFSFTRGMPEVLATNPSQLYFHDTDTSGVSPAGKDMDGTVGSGDASQTLNSTNTDYYWYSESWPTGSKNASIQAGDYDQYLYFGDTTGGEQSWAAYGAVPRPIDKDKNGTGFAAIFVNPTDSPVNVTYVHFDQVNTADDMFKNIQVMGYPNANWALDPDKYGLYWEGTEPVPARSATAFWAEPKGNKAAITSGITITITAGSDYTVSPTDDTEGSGADAAWAGLWLDTNSNPATPEYVDDSTAGSTDTYTVVLAEEVGKKAINAAGTLTINVPAGFTNIDPQSADGDWDNISTDGYTITAKNKNTLSGSQIDFDFTAKPPSYVESSLYVLTASFSGFDANNNIVAPNLDAVIDVSAASVTVKCYVDHVKASDGTDVTVITSSANTVIDENSTSPVTIACGSGSAQTFTSADPRRLRARIQYLSGSHLDILCDSSTNQTRLDPPTIEVPENLFSFLVAAPSIPIMIKMIVFWDERKKRQSLPGERRVYNLRGP